MNKNKAIKWIRRASGTIAFASFLLALGIVGGIETQSIELIPGAIAAALLVGAFALTASLADALTRRRAR